MLTHIEWHFDHFFLKVSCQFIAVFIIFSAADCSFGFLVLVRTVRKTLLLRTRNMVLIGTVVLVSSTDLIWSSIDLVLISTVRETVFFTVEKIMKMAINWLETFRKKRSKRHSIWVNVAYILRAEINSFHWNFRKLITKYYSVAPEFLDQLENSDYNPSYADLYWSAN